MCCPASFQWVSHIGMFRILENFSLHLVRIVDGLRDIAKAWYFLKISQCFPLHYANSCPFCYVGISSPRSRKLEGIIYCALSRHACVATLCLIKGAISPSLSFPEPRLHRCFKISSRTSSISWRPHSNWAAHQIFLKNTQRSTILSWWSLLPSPCSFLRSFPQFAMQEAVGSVAASIWSLLTLIAYLTAFVL